MELQKSLLETWQFFSPFLNSLTADDKYSLISTEYWTQTIQMHLYQKQKILSQFFSAFFESEWNFEHFQKKMTFMAYVFPKITSTEDVLSSMRKRSSLRGHQDRRYGKRAEALIQY